MITNPALRDALCIAFCYLPVQDLLSVSQVGKLGYPLVNRDFSISSVFRLVRHSGGYA